MARPIAVTRTWTCSKAFPRNPRERRVSVCTASRSRPAAAPNRISMKITKARFTSSQTRPRNRRRGPARAHLVDCRLPLHPRQHSAPALQRERHPAVRGGRHPHRPQRAGKRHAPRHSRSRHRATGSTRSSVPRCAAHQLVGQRPPTLIPRSNSHRSSKTIRPFAIRDRTDSRLDAPDFALDGATPRTTRWSPPVELRHRRLIDHRCPMTQSGGRCAGQSLVSPDLVGEFLAGRPAPDWPRKNLQVLPHPTVYRGSPSPPEIIAWHVW